MCVHIAHRHGRNAELVAFLVADATVTTAVIDHSRGQCHVED